MVWKEWLQAVCWPSCFKSSKAPMTLHLINIFNFNFIVSNILAIQIFFLLNFCQVTFSISYMIVESECNKFLIFIYHAFGYQLCFGEGALHIFLYPMYNLFGGLRPSHRAASPTQFLSLNAVYERLRPNVIIFLIWCKVSLRERALQKSLHIYKNPNS